jgi:hypothetical protein
MTSKKPSVTYPGTVEKIIESGHPGVPDKAQVSVEGADELYKEIRIENSLKAENGDDVGLKKGAEVEVTVTADKEATTDRTRKK